MDGTQPGGNASFARGLGMALGALFTVVAIAGFALNPPVVGPDGELLMGFEVNHLHNVVHLAIGIAGLVLSRTTVGAQRFGLLLLVGYGLTFLYGLFVADRDTAANVLALNAADNWLHLVSAIGGGVVFALARAPRSTGVGHRGAVGHGAT